MIRIRRGREPQKLRVVRNAELERVRPLHAAGTLSRDDLGQQYTTVIKDLWRAQFYKCCYCEMQQLQVWNDLEHFRPAGNARRDGHNDPGYWWLAWTWQNLMFACRFCNRTAKNDWFPLQTGSTPLQPEEQPPGNESSLLIDPGSENPIAHIQFRKEAATGRWLPHARNGSPRGKRTIQILQLATHSNFVELYQYHVETCVEPELSEVQQAIAAGDLSEIQKTWLRVTRKLLHPGRPFTALSYDVLDQTFPRAERRRWKLLLHQPKP